MDNSLSITDVLRNYPDLVSLKGAKGSDVEQAEQELSLKFSDEYRQYVMTFGAAAVGAHEFTGVCASKRLNVVKVTQEERESNSNIPPDFYVLEQLGIDDIVIWQDALGNVYQSVGSYTPVKICDSFKEYLAE